MAACRGRQWLRTEWWVRLALATVLNRAQTQGPWAAWPPPEYREAPGQRRRADMGAAKLPPPAFPRRWPWLPLLPDLLLYQPRRIWKSYRSRRCNTPAKPGSSRWREKWFCA